MECSPFGIPDNTHASLEPLEKAHTHGHAFLQTHTETQAGRPATQPTVIYRRQMVRCTKDMLGQVAQSFMTSVV